MPSSDRRSWAILIACGIVNLLLYGLMQRYALGISQSEPSFASDVFPWVERLTKQEMDEVYHPHHATASIHFLLLCAGLLLSYGVALTVVKGRLPSRFQNLVFGMGAVFLLMQVISPFMLSTDVFAYTMYGRVLSVYGANPYSLKPPLDPADPYLSLYGLDWLPSWYGPLWTLVSAGIAKVAGEQEGLAVLLFKLLTIGSLLIAAGLILSILKRTSPERATQGLVFLLWNPLIVIETGLSGHNDAFMLVMVVLGIWLYLKKREVTGVAAITLSAMVKFLTGLILPLYGLMVLRQQNTQSQRAQFVLKSLLVAGVIVVGFSLFSRSDDGVPAAQSATATDFYANNFHELIFKSLRRSMGEEPESVNVPPYYGPWWARTVTPTELHTGPSENSSTLEPVEPGTHFIVRAPNPDQWLWVTSAATHRTGYLSLNDIEPADRPSVAVNDKLLMQMEQGPLANPIVHRANRLIRIVFWALFIAVWLGVAWGVKDLPSFLSGSVVVMIASYYLIITEIWPWYANWAVLIAAMIPGTRAATFAGILSATALTLYATMGFDRDPQYGWLHYYRGAIAFLLPVLLFSLLNLYQDGLARRHGRVPQHL